MDAMTFYTTTQLAELLQLHPQVIQRKLQAGEIPAFRIGKEWRVEHGQLMAWLEKHSNQRAKADRAIDPYFTSMGELKRLPAQRSKRVVILRRLADLFAPRRTYSEAEVNEILRSYHEDVASIRRELVVEKLLVRTTRGVYRRTTSSGVSAIPAG